MRIILSLDTFVSAWAKEVTVGKMLSVLVCCWYLIAFDMQALTFPEHTADGHDMIFDHVSISWGRGEHIAIWELGMAWFNVKWTQTKLSPSMGLSLTSRYPTALSRRVWRRIHAVGWCKQMVELVSFDLYTSIIRHGTTISTHVLWFRLNLNDMQKSQGEGCQRICEQCGLQLGQWRSLHCRRWFCRTILYQHHEQRVY
jgi:hypothetical protein